MASEDEKARIAQALLQAQTVSPNQGPAVAYNPALEAQAAQNQIPMNPLIAALAQRFGFLGMLRNRANQTVIDPDTGLPVGTAQ